MYQFSARPLNKRPFILLEIFRSFILIFFVTGICNVALAQSEKSNSGSKTALPQVKDLNKSGTSIIVQRVKSDSAVIVHKEQSTLSVVPLKNLSVAADNTSAGSNSNEFYKRAQSDSVLRNWKRVYRNKQ